MYVWFGGNYTETFGLKWGYDVFNKLAKRQYFLKRMGNVGVGSLLRQYLPYISQPVKQFVGNGTWAHQGVPFVFF